MYTALVNNKQISIDMIRDSKIKPKYYCPFCGCELVAKLGEIKSHHFAHKHKEDGNTCVDCKRHINWKKEDREWLIYCIEQFKNKQDIMDIEIEQLFEKDGVKDIADVYIPSQRMVILFYNKYFDDNLFVTLNEMYAANGIKHIVWVMNIEKEKYTIKWDYTKYATITYKWKRAKKLALEECQNSINVKIDLFVYKGLDNIEKVSWTRFTENKTTHLETKNTLNWFSTSMIIKTFNDFIKYIFEEDFRTICNGRHCYYSKKVEEYSNLKKESEPRKLYSFVYEDAELYVIPSTNKDYDYWICTADNYNEDFTKKKTYIKTSNCKGINKKIVKDMVFCSQKNILRPIAQCRKCVSCLGINLLLNTLTCNVNGAAIPFGTDKE